MTEAWITFALVALLILLFGMYVLFYKKKRFTARQQNNIRKYWKEVELLAKHNPEQAILRADKLLDHALEIAGYEGTLGQKLKSAQYLFSSNKSVWNAHKIRNKIAHDIHFHPTKVQIQASLKGFRKAFDDLGVEL